MFKRSLLAVSLSLLSLGAVAAQSFYVVVPVKGRTVSNEAISVALSATSLPDGLVGLPYGGTNLKNLLSVTGDPAFTGYGVKWSLASGSLPAGLTLNSDGSISGTPTAGGTSSFQVKATYKTKSGEQAYQILVAAITVGLAAGTPPDALVGTAYSYDLKPLLTVTGDKAYSGAGVTWSVVASTLPAGLYLTADGLIGGTPTAAGTGSVTARATYRGINGEQTYQVVTLDIKVGLNAASLPEAKVGRAYASFDFKNQLNVTGDTAYDVKNVSFTASNLPAGLSVSTAGVLTGTPTTKNPAGTDAQVVATYRGKTGQQVYKVIVNGAYLEATQIAAGNGHTCAVTLSGGVKCWGSNGSGQLGNGTKTDSLTPVDVIGLTSGVARISLAASSSCALTTGGGALCWGFNTVGQLGNGGTVDSAVPSQVTGLSSGVSSITMGPMHTCAVTTASGLKCWGYNYYGELGNGTKANSPVPVDVVGYASGVSQVAIGTGHMCILSTSGGVKCLGYNVYGQLGNNSTVDSATLVDVNGLTSGVSRIAAGDYHSCALLSGGIKCWGYNINGQLGDVSTTTRPTPVAVSGLTSGVSAISAASGVSCAVTTSGAAKCWGAGYFGQLGNGAQADSAVPVNVTGLGSGVAAVVPGSYYTCALLTGGTARCWGRNHAGQLGSGSLADNGLTPVDVLSP